MTLLQYLFSGSFFLYEISFFAFAVALIAQGFSLGRLERALHLPPFHLGCHVAGVLLGVCAALHYVVYRFLSPQYLISGAQTILLWMYRLKTISMLCVFFAGLFVVVVHGLYLSKTTR
jgi:hypothetical protein